MTGVGESPGLGLAEFLGELRSELEEARLRAVGESVQLRVGAIEVEMDIGYVRETAVAGEAKARVKFFVFEFAEAGVSGSVNTERTRTQHLKLTLTPTWLEVVSKPGEPRTYRELPVNVAGSASLSDSGMDGAQAAVGTRADPEDRPAH